MSYADTKSHATATVKGETKEIIMMTTEQYERENEAKDATIARLEAEIAALRAELADLKDGLTAAHMDGFASGKAEAKEMLRKRDGQLEELRAKLEQAEAELAAERGKVEKQYELIDFYDAKVAAVMKWRESAYIPNDSDENELKRILLGE